MFLLWFCSLAWAADPKIPADLLPMVDLDVRYNDRGEYVESADGPKIVPIYHADVPIDQVELTRSKFLTANTEGMFVVEKGGKKFVRIFAREPLPEVPGIERGQKYFGAKVTSHATHLVWDADAPATKRWFIKMTDPAAIHSSSAGSSVHVSDFIEEHSPSSHFMPERLAAYTKIDGRELNNIVREVHPPTMRLAEGEELLPLHGILGSPLPERWNREQWMRGEFLPKAAAWLAELNFKDGIYPESHTQNTLVRINRKTGVITGFAYRDAHDVAVDPLARLLQVKQPITQDIRSMSVINLQHVMNYLDTHLAKGIHRVFTSAFTGPRPQSDAREKIFIPAYRKAAEAVVGRSLGTAGDGRKDFPDAMGEIYDAVIKAQLDAQAPNFRRAEGNELAELVRRRARDRHLALPSDGHLAKLADGEHDYFLFGRHLVVKNKTGSLAAVLYDIEGWERQRHALAVCGYGRM